MADMRKETDVRPKKRWPKWLAWCAGGIVLALVALYFVATSSAFFKSVILPKLGDALNADISVSDAEISPFSRVVLHDLKVTPNDAPTLLTASSVTARYDLLAILRGRIVVDEFSVTDPTVSIVESADGTSNLSPLLKSEKPITKKASRPTPKTEAKPSPPQTEVIDVRTVSLKNATVRYLQNSQDGAKQTIDLTKVNVTVGNIKNGGAGQLDFAADMALDKIPAESGSNATLEANINGSFAFDLAQDLKPGAIKGAAAVGVDQATGEFADLTALAAKFNCDVTPTDIKQCTLAFTKTGTPLGDVQISGPFDAAKMEGKLKIEVTSLDHRVLNLAGAAAGIDFGTTTINTSNEIELTKGGAIITAAGTVNVARFQIIRQNQTSPTLDLRCEYGVSINRPEQSVLVKTLNLTGTQNQHPLVQADLTSPMTIAWGNAGNAVGDAALNVALTGLDLGDWKAFAGDYAPAGVANLKLNVQSREAGKQLTFELDTQVNRFSARIGHDRLPPVDVHLTAKGTGADLKQFQLTEYGFGLAQQHEPVLNVSGTGSFDRATQDANVQVTVQAALDHLSGLVSHWVTAANDYAPSGKANVNLKLEAKQGGKQLAFDVNGQVEALSARVGKQEVGPINLRVVTRGTGADLKQFGVSECRLEVTQQGRSALTISTTGTFDRVTQDADLQVAANAALDRLAALWPQPDVDCSAGTLDVTGGLTSKQQARSITGQFTLAGLTARHGEYRFESFGTTIDLDALMKGKHLEIHKATGQFRTGQSPGGKFSIDGNYDLDRRTGQFTAKLEGFTQNDLGPFLQPSLGDKKLASVSLNTTASAGFDASGNGAIKADVHLANLVVQDPKHELPATPLELRLQIDAAGSNKVVSVHQCRLTLTPTDRAKNELQLSGTVDYSKSDVIAGNLKLAAESLDATAYYDLFSGKNKTSEPKSSSPPAGGNSESASSSSTKEQREPAAVKLPVRNFTCDVNIGRFYLRQVVISNLVTTARVDGSHIVIKPCQLTLNGAPVNATVDLDLGVPGYKYDIACKANRVPLEPLVNSFSPTYSDKAQGNLIATVQINGAGVTGRSLQKSLSGQINLSFTNANIQIVGPKVKAVLTPIALVLGAPELLSSPLDYVNANLQIGNGQIEVRKFVAHSAAFLAESQGSIPMADVLTDSPLNQPVEIALAQSIAGKLRFANLPAQGSYVKLPTFVQLTGTLGDPSAKTDKRVIAGLTAQSLAGAVGGRAGSILQGLGGLLTGQPSATNNAPSGNQPASPFNPFDLLRQPRRR
ncbi:MAG TPA: AsmA family protein [Verrucomicrobiae bacterium]|nr:AsmA family protein [Verrucomicrobiae bacterium]